MSWTRDPKKIIEDQIVAGLEALSAQLAGAFVIQATNLVGVTDDYSVAAAAAAAGTLFIHNTAAAKDCNCALPVSVAGMRLQAKSMQSAYKLTFTPNGSETITLPGGATAASIASQNIGADLFLECLVAGTWVARYAGVWATT